MRPLQFLILMCVLLGGIAANAQSSWQPLSSGTTKNLREVFFTSSDTGYVVGEDSVLLRTTDGGNTWVQLNNVSSLFPGNLNDIWMWGNTGMIVPEYHGGDVKQTSNGGNSWMDFPGAPSLCFPDGIFFVNANEGYLFGNGCFNGAFVSRWNGSGWGNAQLLYFGVTAQFENIGITGVAYSPASGRYVAVGDYGKMFSSTDGFSTFDTLSINDTANFTAVDYIGNNSFIAVNDASNFANVWLSTDGGQTFAPDQNFAWTFYYPGFLDFEALPNGFAVAGGYSMTTGAGFLQTRAATGGWSAGSYDAVDQIVRGVFVVDSTLAFAVGDSGAIYRYALTASVGLHNEVAPEINVYPNPVQMQDNVVISSLRNHAVKIDVTDVAGKLLYTLRDERFTGVVSVSAFTQMPGVYMMHVQDDSGLKATARIVVTR
ncbi:MAG: T9SS type A sorting domain-containing protein [Bacteroidetes bacterium]|nr:T9SS type A sorting domain-containing protein [Bacteroidota bacterium]